MPKTPSSSTCYCASSRYRRLPLSVPLAMMLPWAAPARPHCSQGPPRAMPQGFPGLSLAAAPRYANKTTHCRRSSPPCTTQTNHILSTRGCFSCRVSSGRGRTWAALAPQRWLRGGGAAGGDGQKYAAAAGREIRARNGRGAAQDGPKSGARARGVVTSRRRGAPAPALAACCGTR